MMTSILIFFNMLLFYVPFLNSIDTHLYWYSFRCGNFQYHSRYGRWHFGGHTTNHHLRHHADLGSWSWERQWHRSPGADHVFKPKRGCVRYSPWNHWCLPRGVPRYHRWHSDIYLRTNSVPWSEKRTNLFSIWLPLRRGC